MNEVLRSFIRKFVVVYFDDMLVYSQDEASHTNSSLKCFKSWGNKLYMLNLRSVSFLLLKLSSLDMWSPMRGSKLMKPRLRLSRVGPFLQPSRKSVAFMGWLLSIIGSSRILTPLWLPWPSAWRRVSLSGQRPP